MLTKSYTCSVWGLKIMHKNWVIKGYDQSVTCLADDRKTLEIRSSKPRTPETLSWTNNSIHKHSSIRCKGKTQEKRSKSKVQEKSFDLQKIINRIGATKLKLRSKEVRIQICLKPNFKFPKSCSSCLSGQRGTIWRFWRWFHWIWINEQKVASAWWSGANLR